MVRLKVTYTPTYTIEMPELSGISEGKRTYYHAHGALARYAIIRVAQRKGYKINDEVLRGYGCDFTGEHNRLIERYISRLERWALQSLPEIKNDYLPMI